MEDIPVKKLIESKLSEDEGEGLEIDRYSMQSEVSLQYREDKSEYGYDHRNHNECVWDIVCRVEW